MKNKKKIIVFASGSGTNFINLFNNICNGKIILLITNNSNCGALQFAKKNKIKFIVINKFRYPNDEARKKEYELVLNFHKPDLILLAGFMKIIPENIINIYQNKIMNIHPSLLPKYGGKGFYGHRVHEAVINSRDKESGATVHFVDAKYDKGPIIMQTKVQVKNNDDAISLSKRILEEEYKLYSKVVSLFCEDKIVVKNNSVIIYE